MRTRLIAVLGVVVILGGAARGSAQQRPDDGVDGDGSAQAEAVGAGVTEVPDDRHAVGEPLWMSGLSVLAATYVLTGAAGTTLVMVANARTVTIGESWIPLAGPWIMLADSRGFDSSQIALTVVSGVLQALGCAALIAGLVLDGDARRPTSLAQVWLAPRLGADGAGLSAGGSF
jgi:hypothetical protein